MLGGEIARGQAGVGAGPPRVEGDQGREDEHRHELDGDEAVSFRAESKKATKRTRLSDDTGKHDVRARVRLFPVAQSDPGHRPARSLHREGGDVDGDEDGGVELGLEGRGGDVDAGDDGAEEAVGDGAEEDGSEDEAALLNEEGAADDRSSVTAGPRAEREAHFME